MKYQDSKRIHEEYHKDTKSQNKIISGDNFTYRTILYVINRYLRGEKKVLDIGCGAGTLDFYLANKGHDVTGVDISKNAIKSCTETAKNLGIKDIKFIQINFPKQIINAKFDFIIFSEVIEHLQDDKLALIQIVKLLRKSGILILTTPSIDAPLHKWGLTKEFDKRVGHLRRYDVKQLQKMINESGFKITELIITEGPIRNFLFINPIAGKLVRIINRFFSDQASLIDNFSARIFGGSDIIVVARKVETE